MRWKTDTRIPDVCLRRNSVDDSVQHCAGGGLVLELASSKKALTIPIQTAEHIEAPRILAARKRWLGRTLWLRCRCILSLDKSGQLLTNLRYKPSSSRASVRLSRIRQELGSPLERRSQSRDTLTWALTNWIGRVIFAIGTSRIFKR